MSIYNRTKTDYQNYKSSSNYYKDLGIIIDDSTLENIKIAYIPHEGIHATIKYIISFK